MKGERGRERESGEFMRTSALSRATTAILRKTFDSRVCYLLLLYYDDDGPKREREKERERERGVCAGNRAGLIPVYARHVVSLPARARLSD